MCNKHALNRDTFESLSLSYRCNKQTDAGRVVYIACIPTIALAKFSKSTM